MSGRGRERARDEPGLINDVPIDLEVDRQPLDQVDDLRQLVMQRLGEVTQAKAGLSARQVEPARLLEQLLH
jgi:hypothetical protein